MEHIDDWTDQIQEGLLGFCGCGMAERNLIFVLGGLEILEAFGPPEGATRAESEQFWKERDARIAAHFGNDSSAYFFWYWCAQKDLTEHGGSVPGWLSTKGESLLKILRAWKVDYEASLHEDEEPSADASDVQEGK